MQSSCCPLSAHEPCPCPHLCSLLPGIPALWPRPFPQAAARPRPSSPAGLCFHRFWEDSPACPGHRGSLLARRLPPTFRPPSLHRSPADGACPECHPQTGLCPAVAVSLAVPGPGREGASLFSCRGEVSVNVDRLLPCRIDMPSFLGYSSEVGHLGFSFFHDH